MERIMMCPLTWVVILFTAITIIVFAGACCEEKDNLKEKEKDKLELFKKLK